MCYIKRLTGWGVQLAVALLLAFGCNADPDKGKKADAMKKSDPDKKGSGEAHPEKGPHGGVLAEWGDEKYHAEFTVDHSKKQATIYILDGTARKAAPIPARTITLTITNVKPSLQILLKADPQEGDSKDSASRFTGTHENLGVEMDFKGEISGEVEGTPYTGSFDQKDHKHRKG